MNPSSLPPERIVLPDAGALAAEAVERICRAAAKAIEARGRFTLVLSGGSTPEKTYALLAQPGHTARLDWSRTYLFFGDERCVPHEDSRSNYHLAQRSLLGPIAITPDHVTSVPVDRGSPAANASAYQELLAAFFALPRDGPPPCFDLILLGLGDDGHTASLFPGASTLKEMQAWVVGSPPGTLPPPVDRVTLTFPVLNAARQVMFLVAGANKAEPLRDVLENRAPVEQRPAAGVRPYSGQLTWLIDQAAAQLLRPSS